MIWTWGLSLVALTIAIHATGVVIMSIAGLRMRVRLETRNLALRQLIPIVIGVAGAVGLLLAVLRGIEAAIWAAAYMWLGAFDLPTDAILYSVDSMTTRGGSGTTRDGNRHRKDAGSNKRKHRRRAALLPISRSQFAPAIPLVDEIGRSISNSSSRRLDMPNSLHECDNEHNNMRIYSGR
jgi:hypothetical protein